MPATNDAAVLEAGVMTARGLVVLLAALRANIAAFDERIAELVLAHPDGALFASLPGAGPVLVPLDCGLRHAPRTLRQRFPDAVLQRHRAGEGGQRQNRMGAFPVCLPQVSTPDVSRVRQSLDRAIGVGQGVLSAPPGGGEKVASSGSPGAGV